MLRNKVELIIAMLLVGLFPAFAQPTSEPVDIWQGTACKAKVRLTPYLADASAGQEFAGEHGKMACIVCPGGSYFWHDMKTEGDGVARWLQSQGISAFVLEYRVAGIAGFITHYRLLSRGNRYPDMLQDVQRSIQIIRENAGELGIDSSRLGVMGFSAGGHLSAMSGLFFDTDVLTPLGVRTEVSLRPDFIAPIYPVVSLVDRSTHKRSRRGLLGEGRAISKEMKDSLSLERHVRPDMPLTYLMNCVDDPIVKYRNSELLDSAMTAMNVPHRYVQFRTGGHGFGANPDKTSAEAITWKEDFINWIRNIFR